MLITDFKGSTRNNIVRDLINLFRQFWAQNSQKIMEHLSSNVNYIQGAPINIQSLPKSQYFNDLEGFQKRP